VAGAAAVLPAGHPARTLAAVARGVVLGREGRHDEALFAYEHGLEQGEHPAASAGDAAALLGMGATYLHLEDPEPALQAFQRAHDHAHDQRAAVLSLIGQGDALARLGDGEKAIEANRAAVRLEPGSARTWLGLAAAYQRLRRFAAADSALARATALGGGPAVDALRAGRPADPVAETTTPPAAGAAGGSWVGFWFSSGAGRRVLGLLLVALALALGALALLEPTEVEGLDWLRDDGVGGPAAALLGVVVLLVAPGFGSRAPAPASVPGASLVEPAEPPPSVPLPAAADLVATARAAGGAAAALILAAEVVRAGPTTG
jgi:tetratricopeptide (TPR) repeat protein